MIERIHLAIVAALEAQGTLTRAAEDLHLTQSALSHSMRKLEDELACALWRRDGRRLVLTEAGRRILALSHQVLPLLDNTEHTIARYAAGLRGTLRIGIECHPCYQWLLSVITTYLESWPEVDLDVTQKFQFGGLEALVDRQIDILVTPDPVRRTTLHYEPVLEYQLKLVVAAGHGLPVQEESWIEPEALADQELLTYPVPRDRLDVFTRFLRPAGVVPRRHRHVETTEIMLALVAAGRGVTPLPDYLVRTYLDRMDLVALDLGPRGLGKTLFLGYRDEDGAVGYLRGFLDVADG